MNNEKSVNENEEVALESAEVENEETGMSIIQGFEGLSKNTSTKQQIFTNITDKKKLFNLENHVDNLINDCENEKIRVKEVLIKRYEKPLKNPKVIKEAVIDETTGEVLEDEVVKTTEISMACILIDDAGKSYATGSKSFTIQMMRYLQMFNTIDEKGFEIKITKTKQNSGNKTLGFELV